jgi:hemolysin D
MSDPTTLLLLTCANCLGNNADSVDTATDRCTEQQVHPKHQQAGPQPSNCISPPEAIAQGAALTIAQKSVATDREDVGNRSPFPRPSLSAAKLPQAADTLREISPSLSKPTATAQPKLTLGSTGKAVLQLQAKLQHLGYYSGKLDGRYGKLTRAGVSQFQQAKGLPADGTVGAQTWVQLNRIDLPASQTPSLDGFNQKPFTPTGQDGLSQQSHNLARAKIHNPKSKILMASLLGWVAFLAGGIGVFVLLKKYGAIAQLQTALAGDFSYPFDEDKSDAELEEFEEFEQPVMLQQSPAVPNAIAWTLIGLALFGLTWASVAKIEQVVPARGQLKPQGAVKEIQAPASGVVKKIHIKDGQRVEAGQLLVSFDPTAAKAELESLQKIRASLTTENEFYRTVIASPSTVQLQLVSLKLSPEVALLAQNRIALLEENQLLRTQLVGGAGTNLDADEQARLTIAKAEFQSRSQAAALAVSQLEQDLRKNQAQLADTKARLATDEAVLLQIETRNREAVANIQKSLEIDQSILARIEPLVKEGAIARVQYDRQLQEVTQRSSAVLNESSQGQIQRDRQLQEVQTRKAEIAQLVAEQKRLQFDIAQSRSELNNTTSLAKKGILENIAANKQKIAEIDSQLNKTILENKKQLAEISGKIQQAELSLKYQDLRAPVAGTVFDLQTKTDGFVANSSQVLLKVVPDDSLIAEVYIPNKDIGFVREAMKADIRLESFPFSEFGEIKGEVVSVGSDALPPDENHPFYRFPAKIKLDEQSLNVDSKTIALKSGMSVDVNIKVRENRNVISLITELFTKEIESLEQIR